jgi:hypothetical protein
MIDMAAAHICSGFARKDKEKSMTTPPQIQITEQGLFLPRQLFQQLGEIEIVQGDDYILIKPKNMTAKFKGFIRPHISIEQLHQDYESSLLDGANL